MINLAIIILLLTIFYLLAKKYPKANKYLIIFNTLICFKYIIWRITTIPINSSFTSLLLGLTLYIAELLGLTSFFIFQFLFINRSKYIPKDFNYSDTKSIPSIDVLICTYNEPMYLLEKNIAACTNLEYPIDKINIYVCDDGQRNELKDLCKKYNVNYITRDNNIGAKAGNLNNALKYISGDLFAVLDADMIPKKEFLTKTAGYFENENLAFVQAPQVYYNQDMYQYNLAKKIPNEQDFFMRDIQEARASFNSVLHVGTNALFRRKYIDEIDGYPTCSITEDMAVGMLLQSKGYDSVFVNEELVLGLSACTFTELVKQRDRWCRGNLQVLKHYNPLFSKGLSLKQKISYLDGAIYWFSSIQKMIYVICPLIFLLTANQTVNASMTNLFNAYIPFLIGQYYIFKILSPKTRNVLWAHFYDISMAPHLTMSIIKELFSFDFKFNVTTKEIKIDKKSFQFKTVIPHMFIILTSIIAWIISYTYIKLNIITLDSFLINFFWSLFNFIGAVISVKAAIQQPIYRVHERINVKQTDNISCYINSQLINVDLLDISAKGIGIKVNSTLKNNLNINDIAIINLHNTSYECTIKRIDDSIIGAEFNNLSTIQMKNIMNIFTENMEPYFSIKY